MEILIICIEHTSIILLFSVFSSVTSSSSSPSPSSPLPFLPLLLLRHTYLSFFFYYPLSWVNLLFINLFYLPSLLCVWIISRLPNVIFWLLLTMTLSRASLVFGDLGSFEDYLSHIYRLFLNFSRLGFSWLDCGDGLAEGRSPRVFSWHHMLGTFHIDDVLPLGPRQLAEVKFAEFPHSKVLFPPFSPSWTLEVITHRPPWGKGYLFPPCMSIQLLLFINTDLLKSWVIIKYYIVSIIA